jgi:hypothetical protein
MVVPVESPSIATLLAEIEAFRCPRLTNMVKSKIVLSPDSARHLIPQLHREDDGTGVAGRI